VEDSPSFLARHQFLIRRLHSLSGLVPVGAYMVIHLLTNASVLASTATFQHNVDRIHSLGPLLLPVELAFIMLPILFHAVIGFVIIGGGLPNTGSYPYSGNIRYTLQRVTGVVAFFYILSHILHMHWFGDPLAAVGGGQFEPHHATSSAGEALQANFGVQLWYAVGVLACVYHLANGLWTMGITWGVWTSEAAMRRANYVCAGAGVLVAAIGLSALWGFATVDTQQAAETEQRLEKARKLIHGEWVESPQDAAAGRADETDADEG